MGYVGNSVSNWLCTVNNTMKMREFFYLPCLVFVLFTDGSTLAKTGNWKSLPSLHTGRSEISAVVAGNRIVVAGGIGRFRTLKSCEIYDPGGDNWSKCPDLPYPVHHLAMAADGASVYAAGGYTNLRFSHDDKLVLRQMDIDAAQWRSIGVLPEPVGEHALVHHSDHLYLLGGRTPNGDTTSVWRYSLLNGDWLKVHDMPRAKHSFSALLIGDKIWTIGGRSEELGSSIRSIEIYSIAGNTWRDGPELPVGGGGLFAAYLNGYVHIIGGESFNPNRVYDHHLIYDIAEKSWATAVRPSVPRHGGAMVVIGQDLYLIGGATKAGLSTIYSTIGSVEVMSVVQ